MAAKKYQRPNALPYKYRGLVLDEFQRQALWHIQNNTSTLVSAPTGTGKTLIADFLVEKTIDARQRLIYTAPIKALVNQKYREFFRLYGKRYIGIVTGDVSHQQTAPVVVMTTEILRNMLIRDDSRISDISWVIFDEIHYLNHPERGTVWEEAILFLPRATHILGLSATIPNAEQLGAWIESISQPVAVVEHTERAVPLRHMYFNSHCQAVESEDFLQAMLEAPSLGTDTKGGTLGLRELSFDRSTLNNYRSRGPFTTHLDLVHYAASKRLFPCLYFVFSRQGCEEKAQELAAGANYLSANEKEAVRVTIRRKLQEAGLTANDIPKYGIWQRQWLRGIGVHHAGLLPLVREITEHLLERRLLRVIYATETFAVGVNMPVRTVCFDTLIKYDGEELRSLTQHEYFQMAGRAGRRGWDKLGTAISRIDEVAPHQLPTWDEDDVEPIRSRISISFNMVVNLLSRFTPKEIEVLLHKTLSSFQNRQGVLETRSASELMNDFNEKWILLQRLGYVEGTELLSKGNICRNIYVQEILVTELIASGLILELDPADLAGLAAALVYSPRSGEPPFTLSPPRWMPAIDVIHEKLSRVDTKRLATPFSLYPAISPAITAWAKDLTLREVLKEHPLDPGDLVSVCRQSIDLLRQIITAVTRTSEKDKISESITRLDRGVVRVIAN
ncbi:MAG: DEAD/DEAH box helicase [Firmicutes bacterium]|nr:DEAD/DEAH box helicase [Bacillota bacterium]